MKRIRERERKQRLIQAHNSHALPDTQSGAKALYDVAARFRKRIAARELPELRRADITAEVEPDQRAFGMIFEGLSRAHPNINEAELIYCVAVIMGTRAETLR